MWPSRAWATRAEALPAKAELDVRVSFFILPLPLLSWVTLDWRLDLPESVSSFINGNTSYRPLIAVGIEHELTYVTCLAPWLALARTQ